jgi:hypothetical protein
MTGMFLGASLTKENYDDILIEWSQQSLQSNVYFNAGLSTQYSYGAPKDARDVIISTFNWNIIDGGIEDFPPGNPLTIVYQTSVINDSILLPLYENVNVSVFWGDDTKSIYTTTGDKIHVYETPGIYTVRIFGILERLGNGLNTTTTYQDKIISVQSFGDETIQLNSLSGAFKNAINLVSIPAYLPTTITSLKYTFYGASSLNDPNILLWNTSNVTIMSYTFFDTTSFNQNLENWDKSNVTEQYYMFYGSNTYETNEELILDKILNFGEI